MHPSSIAAMKSCKEFLKHNLHFEGRNVLDVGGRSLSISDDRSYKPIFSDAETYEIADIVDGPGVTRIMPNLYCIPSPNEYFDLVVSGQTLEHVPNPFRLVAEMRRVCSKTGFIIIIVPSSGPRHDVKDYWRFKDDAFEAISAEVSLEIIVDQINRDAPDQRSRQWEDHIFIGRRV